MNEGASAILIHNDESLNTTSGGPTATTLDIMPMLKSEMTAAMSVEVTDCIFAKNELSFGAIANIGGTLSVDSTKFAENSGMGGDIVVTNEGSCTVQESCFDASASIAPGVIFIEQGSEMTENTNNFGVGITAGGYEGGGTCATVFLEGTGAQCLGSTSCSGNCAEFTATTCPVDAISQDGGNSTEKGTTPSTTASPADGQVYVPAHIHSKSEASGSSKVVPIVVAVVVCAFAVFGLIGILWRRRKVSNKASSNSNDSGDAEGSRGGCWKRLKKDKSCAYDEAVVEDDVA
mmetsp:Transcript_5468/g.9713  ORF Transcript_5468/g.9713 Transcript_5468/m.9713 type:complete len:290 (+) Transcript_5468:1-870(+)